MAPPSFADLGKDVRDLFSKGFHNGIVKLDLKTVAENKVEFKVSGSRANDSGKLESKIEGKYKCEDYGLTATETWDTNNKIALKIEHEDKLAKGLKLVLNSNFNTGSGAKDASLKTVFKNSWLNGEIESGLQLKAPVIKAAAVMECPATGHDAWLAGGALEFDTGKNTLLKNELAIGYYTKDLKITSQLKDLNDLTASAYNKVNDNTELGVNVQWSVGTTFTKFGLAAKHKVDKTSHVNFAIDNSSNLKMGYTNEVQPGVKFTFAGVLDTKTISGGDHKIGFGVDFDLS